MSVYRQTLRISSPRKNDTKCAEDTRIRAPNMEFRLQDSPQSNEPAVNSATENIKYRLRPNMRLSQSLIGMTIALDTIYEVIAHVDSSIPADIVPRI